MNLLKEQTYSGKLVIINIHQPGSETYKVFDKVMFIDMGGFQIFYGNPTRVLFTTSCFANILGLNISSAFNSVITI
jgi:ABC-type multidrug transport system ATPase subunit